VIARKVVDLTPELLESMTTAETIPPAAHVAVNLWRHPRDTRVLPKGRNFH
jgi:error-prone DNA polymerase